MTVSKFSGTASTRRSRTLSSERGLKTQNGEHFQTINPQGLGPENSVADAAKMILHLQQVKDSRESAVSTAQPKKRTENQSMSDCDNEMTPLEWRLWKNVEKIAFEQDYEYIDE